MANSSTYWHARCDCGGSTIIRAAKFGWTKSCGCAQREVVGALRRSHGRSGTPEYIAWRGIIARCFNPAEKAFPNYGGRGISVCPTWRHDFAAFLADMGPRPSSKHTVERVENNLGYSKSNCIWADRHTQNRNRRNVVFYQFGSERLCLKDVAARMGVKYGTIVSRRDRGTPVDDMIARHLKTLRSAHDCGSDQGLTDTPQE
jgi:hypothetical protein